MSVQQVEFIQHFTSAQPLLRRYVFTQVPNFHAAEDLLQEIAATLWNKYETFQKDRDFTRWALGVARYAILNSRRAAGRQRIVFTEDIEEALVEHVEGHRTEFDTRRGALSQCRQKLPGKQGQVLAMKYDEEASCEEISAALGMTANSVRILLCRIRQALADCVRRALDAREEVVA